MKNKNELIEIEEFIVSNIENKIASFVYWEVFGLNRSDENGCLIYVKLLDESKINVYENTYKLPENIVLEWGQDNSLIDQFVLDIFGLKQK